MFQHTMPGPWKVHRTVKWRLQQDPSYTPKARPELAPPRDERDRMLEIPAESISRDMWNQTKPTAWMWVPVPEDV